MNKITPFLWFNDQAEEAMHFYASIFKIAHVGDVSRGPDRVRAGHAMQAMLQMRKMDIAKFKQAYDGK